MAVDMGEAAKIFGIGAAVGALGYFIFSKANINIGLPGAPAAAPAPAMGVGNTMTPQVPTQMPGATSMVAFGHDINGDDGWNNSEVWDTRNRKYFSDNILFNKLPYIPLSLESDFDPQNMDFSQAYGPCDQDSPRPRTGTHMLDRELADEFYPRTTPLPHYI